MKKKQEMKKTEKKNGKVDPNKALSRAEVRQITTIADILDEKSAVDDVVKELGDRLYSLDAKEMNPIDRDMMSLRYAILKAYSAILYAMSHFEGVRIRRHDGEYLHRDPIYLMHYLFGENAYTENRLCPEEKHTCDGTCSGKCSGKCSKKCSKDK